MSKRLLVCLQGYEARSAARVDVTWEKRVHIGVWGRGMSRRNRIHVPDCVYYVTLRSTANQEIFSDATDYTVFEQLLAKVAARCRARILFCWEDDAIHLILFIRDVSVGRIMQSLAGQYARLFHGRHGGHGHLFDKRYSSWLVDAEAYLPKLIRHLALLRVRAGHVTDPDDDLRSCHRAYAGLAKIAWLNTSVALHMLADSPDEGLEKYRRLIYQGTAGDDIDFERASAVDRRILGNAEFVRSLPRGAGLYRSVVTLEQVIDIVCIKLGLERKDVISRSRKRALVLARSLIGWYAAERGVATLCEVARRLGRDPSTLSSGIERNRKLRPTLFTLEAFPDLALLARLTPPTGSCPDATPVR